MLIKDLVKSINGEYSAVICYSILAEKRRPQKSEDESNISEKKKCATCTLSSLYTSITGKQLTPKQTEHCPHTYREGLRAAFYDEQKTNDFYLQASDRAVHPEAKRLFARTAFDEQRHAVWFYTIYTLLSTIQGNGIKRAEHKLHRGKYRKITVQADHAPRRESSDRRQTPFFQHERMGFTFRAVFILPLNNG